MRMMARLTATAAFGAMLVGGAPLAADNHAPDPIALVAAEKDRTVRVAKALWDYAELG